MVQDFDMEVSRIIMERFIHMVTVRSGGDAAWFDGDCRRAFELKQSAYRRWHRNRNAVNRDLFCQHEVRLSLITLLIDVEILMIVPLLMPGAIR